MLTAFVADHGKLQMADPAAPALPAAAVWIDLDDPTSEEERLVESHLGIEVPSQEDMLEIEISSRLYSENDALFMTAILLVNTDTDSPAALPISFILANSTLITVRYSEPRSVRTFVTRAQRAAGGYQSGETVLIGLLEAVVDRTADILERVGADLESLSREVFERPDQQPAKAREFREILRNIGKKGDLNGKARESLVSLGRLLAFFLQSLEARQGFRDVRNRLKTQVQDINSLSDYASFLSNKCNLLLDATLGMINIEQNAIIKIFSVAAVVFLPPTLIASIYGMNFRFMPELGWPFGYPLALLLMIATAIVPCWFFKHRGWL